jgi:hypothetical protein
MKELNSARKIKINLSDYDYETDIRNRLLMAEFSDRDRKILEEILYSSVKIPISKLVKNLDIDEKELFQSLKKLSKTGLFTFHDGDIIVDKQLRKYYEFQILKFADDFRPDLEFVQGLLKKVPIHVLPNWYSIPRTSNNIFESLIEKYLYTPHHFLRSIEEIQSKDKITEGMIQDVFSSPNHKVFADEIKQRYNLSDYDFEKQMLVLEFSFALCLTYSNVNGFWKETVTPFYEWHKYLSFINDSRPSDITDVKNIKRYHESDFIFIKDLVTILENLTSKGSVGKKELLSDASIAKLQKFINYSSNLFSTTKEEYIKDIIEKLVDIEFLSCDNIRTRVTREAKDWLDLTLEKKASVLYQHPLNGLPRSKYPSELYSQTFLRRAEKSINRVLNNSWIYFDDFIKGIMVPLTDDQFITLKKEGKNWEYSLPRYTNEQFNLIKVVVLKWLQENGIIAIGTHENRDCFKVTDFGKKIFEN